MAFDDYYSGTMRQVVPRDDESERAELADLRRMDAAIRARFALAPVATAHIRARSFAHVRFPDDRATLTLSRRVAPRP